MPDPTTTRVIPMCELCRRVYDHPEGSGQTSRWTQLHAYVTRHNLHSRQILFSHSYCDDCQQGYTLAAAYGQH